jgi:DNA-binding response OmpR family regulator
MKEGKHVILYVDDDRDFLDTTRIVLESKGFIVETAESAEEGLKAFKRCSPDLVLVDLMMEEVDAGAGLVKDLKLAGNAAPVYMLSSVGDQLHMSTDTGALGLSGVFQKPVNFDNLVRTIQQKLG